MKKIKFKGKRLDNKGWACGNLIKMDSGGSQSFIFPFYEGASTLSCGQLVSGGMVPVDINTVEQIAEHSCENNEEIKLLTGVFQHLHEAYMLAELYREKNDYEEGILGLKDVNTLSLVLSKIDDELNRRAK